MSGSDSSLLRCSIGAGWGDQVHSPQRTDEVLDIPVSLDELTAQLGGAVSLKEVMAIVRRGARSLIQADGITFVLRDGNNCHYAEEDAISPLWEGSRFPIETCVSGLAMLSGEPVAIEDIYADSRVPHAAYRPTFVRSLLMMPVSCEGQPVAAIGAYWARRHTPTTADIDRLRQIAEAAAAAIRGAARITA